MKIGVQEAARLLSVSEKTIYRWIRAGSLPGYRVHDQYRFNRSELLAWAISRRINVPEEAFHDSLRVVGPVPTLAEAVQRGGIHYRVQAEDKEAALRATVEWARAGGQVGSQHLLSLVLAREALAPTGVGDGVAIPQLLYPNVLDLEFPMITLIFLEAPVEYDSFDGKQVKTLFGLFSASLRAYHILLNRLYYSLRDRRFLKCLQQEEGRNQIVEHLVRIESSLRKSSPLG
ncbi:MAG: helix-turn-helix domain-containing protein [Candidatus Eremiobacteraeota bacterium]|nr:helix-turn-helix domain-containing protein [Candidatus Eremiobacteraeota bacterium]MCW5870727.1 helix-turn-helix domain-containing protein [Candidatus Eremiobacteraeota bacterium]